METFYELNKLGVDKNKSALISAHVVFYNEDWASNPSEKIQNSIIDLAALILTEDKINCLVGKGLATTKKTNGSLEIYLTKKGVEKSLESGYDIRNF